MLWGFPWREKPGVPGCALFFSARGSIRRLKIEGGRGHPCLVPLVMEKGRESIFEVYACAHGKEYRARIADRMGPENPHFLRVWAMYPQ